MKTRRGDKYVCCPRWLDIRGGYKSDRTASEEAWAYTTRQMGRRRHLTCLRTTIGPECRRGCIHRALRLDAPSVLLMSAAIASHCCQRQPRIPDRTTHCVAQCALLELHEARTEMVGNTSLVIEPTLPVWRRCWLELHGVFWFLHILVLLFPRDVPQNRNARCPLTWASNEAAIRERQLIVQARPAGCGCP